MHDCWFQGWTFSFQLLIENVNKPFLPLSPQSWLISTSLLLERQKYCKISCLFWLTGSVTEAECYLFKLLQIFGVRPCKTEEKKAARQKEATRKEPDGWMGDGWMDGWIGVGWVMDECIFYLFVGIFAAFLSYFNIKNSHQVCGIKFRFHLYQRWGWRWRWWRWLEYRQSNQPEDNYFLIAYLQR